MFVSKICQLKINILRIEFSFSKLVLILFSKQVLRMKTKFNKLLIFCVITVIVIIIYFVWRRLSFSEREFEPFQITSGMITPQRHFYGKCIDDCWRNFTGDSSEGQFNWLCTDACEKKAAARVAAGLPDISYSQYERHTGLEGKVTEKIEHCDGITETVTVPSCNRKYMNSKKLNNITKHSDILQSHNIFNNSDYFERCYCSGEVKDWCENMICTHNINNRKQCLLDCQRTRAVNCNAGLDWSWKP